MTAYTEYQINSSRLKLLRNQEWLVKNKTKEFEQKKKNLSQVTRFVKQAEQLGLTKNKWDTFFVTLKNEFLSFSALQTLLTQTSNSQHYYFKPESLAIQIGSAKITDINNNPEAITTPPVDSANSTMPGSNQTASDITISLKGHFLVKQRGRPND